jgi:hypothetical protein
MGRRRAAGDLADRSTTGRSHPALAVAIVVAFLRDPCPVPPAMHSLPRRQSRRVLPTPTPAFARATAGKPDSRLRQGYGGQARLPTSISSHVIISASHATRDRHSAEALRRSRRPGRRWHGRGLPCARLGRPVALKCDSIRFGFGSQAGILAHQASGRAHPESCLQ